MKLIVNPHKIQLVQDEAVNEKEINVSKCEFEFADEITDDFVKEAYFTLGNDTYKKVIVNNECTFPQEVLVKEGTIELGVVAYLVENEEEIKRYNPTPVYFKTDLGSLKEAQNSEEPTPSEMEQYEQALQDGLNELDNALDDLQDKVDSGYFKGDKGDKGDTGNTGATGEPGRDGAIQYTPGDNITIENNVISAEVPDVDLTNYYTKSETNNITGLLSDLSTTDKTNLVNAINELASSSGGTDIKLGLLSASTNYNVLDLDEGIYLTNGMRVSLNNEVISWSYSNSYVFVSKNNSYNKIAIVFNPRNAVTNSTSGIFPIKVFRGDNAGSYINIDLSTIATTTYVDNAISTAITDALNGGY